MTVPTLLASDISSDPLLVSSEYGYKKSLIARIAIILYNLKVTKYLVITYFYCHNEIVNGNQVVVKKKNPKK